MREDDTNKTLSLSFNDDVKHIESLDDKSFTEVHFFKKWISKIKDSVPHRYYKYIHTLEPVEEESENNNNNNSNDNDQPKESCTTNTTTTSIKVLFGQMLELLSNNSPETKSTVWFSLNFMLLISASYVSFMVHQYADNGAKFPTSSYIVYQIVATAIWCVEALTSSLYSWMKQPNNNYKVVVCIELFTAIYFLISFIFIGTKLSPEEKGSALPSTELDSFLYLLACTYNIYCTMRIPENDTSSNDNGKEDELNETNKKSSMEQNDEEKCCKMENYNQNDIELVSKKTCD